MIVEQLKRKAREQTGSLPAKQEEQERLITMTRVVGVSAAVVTELNCWRAVAIAAVA